MKIDSNYTNPLQSQKLETPQSVEKTQRQQNEKVGQTQQAPQRDRLELSDKAKLLSKARTALDVTPEVNAQKVEGLKESIRQGTYQIPYEGLAQKMVGNVDVKG
jgi:flagellar biosynthesis anti-sigma factor FlgM